MLALEIARAATGRRKVLMAARGYHGSHGAFEAGTFGHEGPETLLAPFGDAEAFAAVLSEHGSDVACVVLEPVLGSGGVVEAGPEFFAQVQAATARAGAVFVLDEVITFRLSTGGAQALLDVTPDLTAMGKIIGGGFPVGAVGGRADLMALTDPMGEPKVHHSGTFNGNPVTTAAGIVSVQHLTSDAIGTMDTLTARFETSLVDAGEVPLSTRRVGSLLQVVFDDERAVPLFHLAALNHGLFLRRERSARTVNRRRRAPRRRSGRTGRRRPRRRRQRAQLTTLELRKNGTNWVAGASSREIGEPAADSSVRFPSHRTVLGRPRRPCQAANWTRPIGLERSPSYGKARGRPRSRGCSRTAAHRPCICLSRGGTRPCVKAPQHGRGGAGRHQSGTLRARRHRRIRRSSPRPTAARQRVAGIRAARYDRE